MILFGFSSLKFVFILLLALFKLFKLVSKYKAKCIFGSDAHAPNQIYDETANYEAVYFAKKHDLIILDKLDTIR